MTWEYAATLLSCINAHAQKNVFFFSVLFIQNKISFYTKTHFLSQHLE